MSNDLLNGLTKKVMELEAELQRVIAVQDNQILFIRELIGDVERLKEEVKRESS